MTDGGRPVFLDFFDAVIAGQADKKTFKQLHRSLGDSFGPDVRDLIGQLLSIMDVIQLTYKGKKPFYRPSQGDAPAKKLTVLKELADKHGMNYIFKSDPRYLKMEVNGLIDNEVDDFEEFGEQFGSLPGWSDIPED